MAENLHYRGLSLIKGIKKEPGSSVPAVLFLFLKSVVNYSLRAKSVPMARSRAQQQQQQEPLTLELVVPKERCDMEGE
jgi:hypothetical protein